MFVMAGLVPAIHDFMQQAKTWMPGTRPAMTRILEGREFYKINFDRSAFLASSPICSST
jgi:hypothetical protein